jgi:hypothetical protein
MWDHYGKGGVAIRTTYGQLRAQLEKSPLEIYLGRVKYIDFNHPQIKTNARGIAFFKRLSYSHENEVRAVYSHHVSFEESPDPKIWRESRRNAFLALPKTLTVPVSLKELINKIYVSPDSPSWYEVLVRDIVTSRYHVKCDIEISDVNSRPSYR